MGFIADQLAVQPSQQSMGERLGSYLLSPQFQNSMFNLGRAFSPPQVVGGKIVPGTGAQIADAFQPAAQGQVLNEGIQAGTKAFGQTQPQPQPQKSMLDTDNPLGFNLPGGLTGNMLASNHIGGYSWKTPDGSSYKISSFGPKDYMEADVIKNQMASGQPRASAAMGGNYPFESSSSDVGGQSMRSRTPTIEMFKRAAERHGVPLNWLLALAKHESRFDPNAVSPKGAIGVMQVMPETGKMMGYSRDQLFDPESSIDAGAKYARYLSDKYKIPINDARRMTGAYNTGGTNYRHADQKYVKRVVADTEQGYIPDEIVEPIQNQTPVGTIGGNYAFGAGYDQQYQAPDFSGMPSLYGLNPEQVEKVYDVAGRNARIPATIGLENAQAAKIRLGMKADQPTTVDGYTVTGKEALDYRSKMAQIDAMKKHYEEQLMRAQTMDEYRDALKRYNDSKTEEKRLEIQQKEDRQKLIKDMDERGEKVPGSELTYSQAATLGILDDLLKAHQTTTVQDLARGRTEFTLLQKLMNDLVKMYEDPILRDTMIRSAKEARVTPKQYIESRMTQANPRWREILGITEITLPDKPDRPDPLGLFTPSRVDQRPLPFVQ